MDIRLSLIIIVLITLLSSYERFAQGGEIYKWTDSNGVVHYSDTKPGGQNINTLTNKSSVSSMGKERSIKELELKALIDEETEIRINECKNEAKRHNDRSLFMMCVENAFAWKNLKYREAGLY